VIKLLFSSVFTPKAIPKEEIERKIFRFGYMFILTRWAYYSILFSFLRDYHRAWSPFFMPPFGLSLDVYAFWQSILSVPFGLMLMAIIATVLSALLKTRGGHTLSVKNILNVLGVTYFVPFAILQPLDVLAVIFAGWIPIIIIPLHTVVLVWEGAATVILLHKLHPVSRARKVAAVFLQVFTWIALCAVFWR
jgi:hypothetical protein